MSKGSGDYSRCRPGGRLSERVPGDGTEACLFLIRNYDDDLHISIGVGDDVSIVELTTLIQEIVRFTGRLEFDASKPDSTPRRLVDTTRINALGRGPRAVSRARVL